MTKGRVTLPFGGMVATTTAQTLFIPDETCRRQVTLLPMNKRRRAAQPPLISSPEGTTSRGVALPFGVAPRKKPAHRRPLLFPPLLDSRGQRCGFCEKRGKSPSVAAILLDRRQAEEIAKTRSPSPTRFPNMPKIRMPPVCKDAWGVPTVGFGTPIQSRPHNGN